ncbi:hypothetical protein BU23DRAFT_565703 [Bimuria novae-zelandiae CBS 107.79]|uniref:Uncharacterized protein n=1 Tax=Bimuria novae-zelandiae CBS 107.79 TaxID=1447943 RepID=A0A6A5VH87_9PLEO|nr:hypothetical protein BU23DRAFT_565703 [Bimuria novae-zelandiae CBS 107.79]
MHLLERDLPEYHAYHYYLRRKLPNSFPSNFTRGSEAQSRTDIPFSVSYARFGYAVLWSHVVFALKAERFGAHYGISLDAFSHDAEYKPGFENFEKPQNNSNRNWNDIQICLSVRARIVSGHLLLRCTYTFLHEDRTLNRDDLMGVGLDVCRHTSTQDRNVPWFENHLANAIRGPPYYFAAYDPLAPDGRETMEDVLSRNESVRISGHCAFCFTEYTVREITQDQHEGLRGCCLARSGQRKVRGWYTLVEDGRMDRPRRPRSVQRLQDPSLPYGQYPQCLREWGGITRHCLIQT